jgi:hypothetical protein
MPSRVPVEIAIDRFTTIRKMMPTQVVKSKFNGSRSLYVPEYDVDVSRGAPQVDPDTHMIKSDQESHIKVLDKKNPGSKNLTSHHDRSVKMYKCKYCGIRSEDRDAVKTHVRECKLVNK